MRGAIRGVVLICASLALIAAMAVPGSTWDSSGDCRWSWYDGRWHWVCNTTPVPVGTIGLLGLAAALGLAFFVGHRRSRRSRFEPERMSQA
jgi:hypothetical protein